MPKKGRSASGAWLLAMGTALCTSLVAGGREARAQAPSSPTSTRTIADDRARVAEVLGRGEVPDDSTSLAGKLLIRPLLPVARFVWNSKLPSEYAAGPLWAGRGANASVVAGFAMRRSLADLTAELRVAPSATYSQNKAFQTLPGREPGRSPFSSPWHFGIASADLPPRFGDAPVRTVGPGESALTLSTRGVAVGVSSSTQWWGPALRNTLVLSDNAEGIPRVFVQSARPLRTRIGLFTGQLFIGTLTESAFFDTRPDNDHRSASGMRLTYAPSLDTLLSFGISRLVIAPSSSGFPLARSLDVLTRWEPISDTSAASRSMQSTDQLFSFFARWRFPASGLETYAEWARMDFPRSFRDFLVAPHSTSGYTLGAQLVSARSGANLLRGQVELTYLEQTQAFPDRLPPDFYTGRATEHGFTQRGQVLGAEIGPGGSTQFAAVDWLAPRWQAGAYVGRARRENEALYRQPEPLFTRHDVEMYVGVRGGLRRAWGDTSWDLTVGQRRNYLFQNNFNLGGPVVANDVQNVTLSMLLSPSVRR